MTEKMDNKGGLIHAYLLDESGGGRRLEMPDIESWGAEQGVLWMYFDYSGEDAQQWLRNFAALEELVADALLTEENRPRSMTIDDGVLLALRGISMPGAEPDDMT